MGKVRKKQTPTLKMEGKRRQHLSIENYHSGGHRIAFEKERCSGEMSSQGEVLGAMARRRRGERKRKEQPYNLKRNKDHR